MSLANKLTVLRIVMIPVFLLFLYLPVPYGSFWAALVFTLASVTDILDGYVARREKKITAFGKAFDRRDRPSFLHDRQRQACIDAAAVDEHGARAALAAIAALFRAGHAEVFAQRIEQRDAGFDG